MKLATVIALLGALSAAASSPFAPPDLGAIHSLSDQFLVYDRRPPTAQTSALATETNYLSLNPTLLAISCERVKQALWRELALNGPWRSRIYLSLQPAEGAADPITIVSEALNGGWNYHLELPDTVERARFVRALVNVLLLEQANREAAGRSAEIPVWLGEGLTQQLLLTVPDIVLTPPPTRWTPDGRAVGPTAFEILRGDPSERARRFGRVPLPRGARVIWIDPIESARRDLLGRPPLTLDELSWPNEEQLSLPEGAAYRSSAQLFVTELLRLKDGRASMRAMLVELGRSYNWQTAFFRAFHEYFQRPLDLEKWWALQVVNLTGRDPSQTWTPTESWARLDEILRVPVQVRRSPGTLPVRADVPLQTVIRDWNRLDQTRTFRAKLGDLDRARRHMAQDLVGLVDEYRQVLAKYLQELAGAGVVIPTAPGRASIRSSVVRDALRQVDALEARRQALRPQADVDSSDAPEASSLTSP